ncbi:hypothetical protein O181_029654 [Austropuccinia psidii MF-1]|uniref:Reverse transcriptase Ty1/copia-type domain-containing protein n=1 Tax=Austropuccinia psidii MF-1 TaxID=1389203 RepID=A0A9Q3H4S2_9BASI|nr:hypothetical protein [Austropuccinia psidii MF-1]
MDIWEEVKRDSNIQTLGTRWVFALKLDSDGKPIRHKAWLVVQGHRQIRGVNFEETFAPTPLFGTLRSILPIASNKSWKVNTFDVTSAYLHSKIDEVIFVRPPPGITLGENKVLKLKRALYGLKQAGRCWWMHLKSIFQEMGFNANENDQSTYTYKHGGECAMLWIHVDDGVLTASSKTVMERLKLELTTRLKLRWDEEINSIVGIEIKRQGKGFILKQPGLIKKVITGITNQQQLSISDRDDILFSSSYASGCHVCCELLSQICNECARQSLEGTQTPGRLHQYLKIGAENTRKNVEVYVDANWGGEGSRSQHGFCILLHGTIVASTFQAEYMALSFAAREALWLVSNLEEVIGRQCPILLSDNKSAVQIANNSSSRK